MTHLFQEIAESIRRRIATGEFAPRDRLPAVRELAEQWHCTPGTVSRAYQELAEQGLVGGHRGSGTRVLENPLFGSRPDLEWANLVNRAERFLLEALSSGHNADQAQSALSVAVSRWQTLQEQAASEPELPAQAGRLRFAGSHDLAMELLARRLASSKPDFKLELNFSGSLGGVIALIRGEADIAGVHLWDAKRDSYNLPLIQRMLPNQHLALVTLAYRQLGFMVPQGNPQRIKKLADLTRPGVRWINRQQGSGTRIWLDEQLKKLKVEPGQIHGYSDERATHVAVAEAVQSGLATAGLGIQAAALAYGLTFVPLTEELYQLVVQKAVWDTAVWQALLTIIRSESFRSAVADMGGYNTAHTGEETWT